MGTHIASLRSKAGTTTQVGYDFRSTASELVRGGDVDAFIVGGFHGFVPYGAMRDDLADELGMPVRELDTMAGQVHDYFGLRELTAVAVQRRDRGSDRAVVEGQHRLRGVVLAPDAYSRAYELFAQEQRDFYYCVTYQAIALACRELNATRLAISHLSKSHEFREDIATWTAEALADFCEASPNEAPESLLFVGCCIGERHLRGIKPLFEERNFLLRPAIGRYETDKTTWVKFVVTPSA